ncbi:MAG: hypothetical protein ACTSU5_18030 [Promethearchaeota archaeon]
MRGQHSLLGVLGEAFEDIHEQGQVTPEHIDVFERHFPGKLTPALELVANDRVVRYETDRRRVFWVVQGRTSNYLVFPDFFCTCTDFLMRGVLRNDRKTVCYHIISRKLAEAVGHFEEMNVPESEFERDVLKREIKLFR